LSHRVIVVTSEIPADLGYPTAGGGVRAWNLAAGLRQQGFQVDYALAEAVVEGRQIPDEHKRYLWNGATLNDVVLDTSPEVLLFCHWDPMTHLRQVPCPVVVDLSGPLILEYFFTQRGEVPVHAQRKLRTLSTADAFLVTSPRLRAYFTAWLTMAGVAPDDFPLLDVPVSLPEPLPPIRQRAGDGEPVFLYSGIAWPWQDPRPALQALVEVLEKAERGKLIVYTGTHPVHKVAGQGALSFLEDLKRSSRVEVRGMVPYAELAESYAEADVAVDVTAPNLERELASPFRTIGFLWGGVAPVVGRTLFLADELKAAGAGWSVDPEDGGALRRLFEWILEHPDDVFQRRHNAQAFVRHHHTWDKALGPLVEFCSAPRYRPKHRHLLDTTIERLHKTREEMEKAYAEMGKAFAELGQLQARYDREREEWNRTKDALERRVHRAEHDLAAIRSKFLFRFFKRFQDLVAPERKPEPPDDPPEETGQ